MKKEILGLAIKIILIIVFGYVVFQYVFGICRMNDDSMSPAMRNGDLVFYYRMQKELQASDVVVIEKDGEMQIRRIIAKPGDVVDIQKDGLMINGYYQNEPMIYTETLPYKEGISFPITLGKEEYFVLGDQREYAKDSRIYGTISKEEIKGLVITFLRRRNF